tara:strand:- start:34 stop:285 length:252 start_codon:yes stop_codon:yes gene_type:complete
MRQPMSRAESRRQKRFHEANDDGTEIFGEVPIGMKMQLALEPCEELNGKTVADLIIETHRLTDIDKLSQENYNDAIDKFLGKK